MPGLFGTTSRNGRAASKPSVRVIAERRAADVGSQVLVGKVEIDFDLAGRLLTRAGRAPPPPIITNVMLPPPPGPAESSRR